MNQFKQKIWLKSVLISFISIFNGVDSIETGNMISDCDNLKSNEKKNIRQKDNVYKENR